MATAFSRQARCHVLPRFEYMDEFGEWLERLDAAEQEAIARSFELLRQTAHSLGRLGTRT